MSLGDAMSLAQFAIFAASLAISVSVGWVVGRKRGIDEGWVAHYMEQARQERERRDHKGRFRSTRRDARKIMEGLL